MVGAGSEEFLPTAPHFRAILENGGLTIYQSEIVQHANEG